MRERSGTIQNLVSLPANMSACFESLTGHARPEWFACSDPPGHHSGPAAGRRICCEAWQQSSPNASFGDWLSGSRKLIVHGAAKAAACRLTPPKANRSCRSLSFDGRGASADQTLWTCNSRLQRVCATPQVPKAAMVASGDVLLAVRTRFAAVPVSGCAWLGHVGHARNGQGLWGVLTPRENPQQLALFLQKPSPARIRELATDNLYLVDTGMWLLSERAVEILLQRAAGTRTARSSPEGRRGFTNSTANSAWHWANPPRPRTPRLLSSRVRSCRCPA